jgi:hypothetical protein
VDRDLARRRRVGRPPRRSIGGGECRGFLHNPELPVHHVTGSGMLSPGFTVRIHKTFACVSPQLARQRRMIAMSISSIPASAPAKAPESAGPQVSQPKPDGDADKVGAPQPIVLAALPPGQGTRIDQLV